MRRPQSPPRPGAHTFLELHPVRIRFLLILTPQSGTSGVCAISLQTLLWRSIAPPGGFEAPFDLDLIKADFL